LRLKVGYRAKFSEIGRVVIRRHRVHYLRVKTLRATSYLGTSRPANSHVSHPLKSPLRWMSVGNFVV
jgi:hypothetical protein